MREIVIGTTDVKPNFNSRCLWRNADASENTVFYIFCMETPEIRVYVYKDSKIGEEIKDWLSHDENRNNESVQRKAFSLILPHLTYDEFVNIVNEIEKHAWQKGYDDGQRELRNTIRTALGFK